MVGSTLVRPRTIDFRDDALVLLDQRALPHQIEYKTIEDHRSCAKAIQDMVVRGAPAIGIAAAYGMALAAKAGENRDVAHKELLSARPTAVNLEWALNRIRKIEWQYDQVLAEARMIHEEDEALCERIANNGLQILGSNAVVMTICNTGSLATGGIGTAYGIIRRAHEAGKIDLVYSLETRPRLQGLTLTAWELKTDLIPFRSIPDGAAAFLLSRKKVDAVIAGADRIAANGDTANKIGTMSLAIAARQFGVPFYIAAPTSTIDPLTPSGSEIEIEERNSKEITHIAGHPIAPEGTQVWNPAFDVTPGEFIEGIITENDIYRFPYRFGQE